MSYDLVNKIEELTEELDQAIKNYAKFGADKAAKERDYKITLRQEALRLRAAGESVTFIGNIVYGEDKVAAKRFERDKAVVFYEAQAEKINALKLEIRIINEQIAREWGKNG